MGLGEPECLEVAISSLCWEKGSSLGYLLFFRSSSVMAVSDLGSAWMQGRQEFCEFLMYHGY